MSAKDPHTNPVLEATIFDIFDNDPETLSEVEFNAIIKYYRDLRITWSTKEDEKKEKKTKKKADILRTTL